MLRLALLATNNNTAPQTAVVAGGTGLVGGLLLDELARQSGYSRTIALVRRAVIPADGRIEYVVGGLDDLTPVKIEPGAHLFCALGTTIAKAGSQAAFRAVDYELPLKFAQWGRSNGSSCFVLVSAAGAGASSSNFYSRTKGELERDLQPLAYPALHIFEPSLILGPRPERRPLEAIAMPVAKALSFAMLGGLRKYRPIPAEHIAKAMVVAAQSGRAGVHRYVFDHIEQLAAGA